MLEHALHYAKMGLSVIPVHSVKDGECSCGSPRCNAPGKHPRLKWKGRTKTALTERQLRDWWEKYPDSNVGIVTGEISGIAVVDIDGEEGLRSLEEAGLPIDELPTAPTAKTGGGGIHIIYRYPEKQDIKTRAGILPNVDIRSDGGFIVAPPSVHISGNSYEWMEGRNLDDLDPSDFDFSLLVEEKDKADDKPKTGTKWYENYLRGVGEGERNNAATKLAGRYYSMGMSDAEVSLLLSAWNMNNNPPIPENELQRVISSIKEREYKVNDQKKDELLDTVSNILRVNLSAVKRITGDEPQFVLEFDEGTCTLTTGQLLSPKSFQQAVAEATKVVVRKLSTKTNPTHDNMVQMIMDCAEDVDAGMEATGVGELMVLLKDFLGSQQVMPTIESGEDIPRHGCFRMNGLVWVSLMDLVQRSGARWGMRTSIRQMAQRLRALGIERKTFNLEDGGSRIMWGIDTRKMGLEEGSDRSEKDKG